MAVPTCACGAELCRLVFGMPDPRDLDAGLLDEVVLGGCLIRGGGADPNHACPRCERRYVWFRGHVFAEESWLEPVGVVSTGPELLGLILMASDGREVALAVASDDHAFPHFQGLAGMSSDRD